MLEIIQQNPVISFFAGFIPLVAGTWKVMDVLFVKPRDFRIAVLENNVEEIRKQLQRNEPERVSANPPSSVSAPSQDRSISGEALEEKGDKFEKIVETTSLLNDMDLFYESWKDNELTELQRDQFEKSYVGQKVVWTATFSSVREERDGYLWVSLTSKNKKNYGIHVIAVFEENHKEALLAINKDELVQVSGMIDSFSLAPLIRKCSISRRT
ncbi:hypothetical protein EZI54_22705 [Marinobacter halodurans]|uniref:Uncharacterized protein n=1 Tax=Marinobacter halodurans TaxID=2528979 RepID=A0ABY1ZHU9_9GAMM|nr:hypothetical protein [Marinobacter halodurans]TBW47472.1 hypothetical protein EZI54_22705 [Marinobacter halodurans]